LARIGHCCGASGNVTVKRCLHGCELLFVRRRGLRQCLYDSGNLCCYGQRHHINARTAACPTSHSYISITVFPAAILPIYPDRVPVLSAAS
jgi:hypothetical protein